MHFVFYNIENRFVFTRRLQKPKNAAYPNLLKISTIKGGVGKFEKPARDTLFVIFHGMLLTSR